MATEAMPAQGPVDVNVMPPDDMLPMENAQGKKFALKFNPEHQQHGWIFYDNDGTWITLRRATDYEMMRAEAIIKMRDEVTNGPL